ncbi:MAG: DUF1566 domain-containing protein [Rikenellaceae bacterium]
MNVLKNLNSKVARVALLLKIASISLVGYGQSVSNLSYPQVATGQILAYDADGVVLEGAKPGDALYGQDAHYLVGAQMSYKDNGDGTVTDLNTGLMWQMIPVNQGFSWQGAKDYCENLELAGYDDWRLPSAKELYSISDFGTGWPYINTDFFKLIDTERVGKDEQYWSSHRYVGTMTQGGSSLAFGVNHATGHIKAYGAGDEANGGERPQMGQNGERPQARQGGQRPPMDSMQMDGNQRPQARQGGQRPPMDSMQMDGNQRPQARQGGQRPPMDSMQMDGNQRPLARQSGQGGQRPQGGGQQQGGGNRMQKYVRAVRGNAYGVNNFADNGDGTISDKATGLMWAKVDSKEGMEWIKALKYAEDAELAGYTDWRLPNVKELQGIVDYNYAPSAADPAQLGAAIDPIFSCSEITNENGDKDYPYFWTNTSAIFRRGQPFYFAWYVSFGRAVDPNGLDSHGAGAVRFFSKHEGGPAAEGGARSFNYVRLVRNIK